MGGGSFPEKGLGMKEHPILFSGDMVRAILEGRKTQTRRVIKKILGFTNFFYEDDRSIVDAQSMITRRGKQYLEQDCPYGQLGDRLWVRETWTTNTQGEVLYCADWKNAGYEYRGIGWNSPVFMP